VFLGPENHFKLIIMLVEHFIQSCVPMQGMLYKQINLDNSYKFARNTFGCQNRVYFLNYPTMSINRALHKRTADFCRRGSLDSMERGTLEWNSGNDGGTMK
jgi:hypothetical protein